jgi:ketosteroid isomerase-like protein
MSRHLDERLALRFPGLFRFVAARVTAMPPGSRLRYRLLKRAVDRAFEAVSRRDIDAAVLGMAPDCELNNIGEPVGFAKRFRGHEGIKEFFQLWLAEWGAIEYALEDLVDLGDRLVYRYKATGRGGTSGVPVTLTQGAVVYLENGRTTRYDLYWDWADLAEKLPLDEHP